MNTALALTTTFLLACSESSSSAPDGSKPAGAGEHDSPGEAADDNPATPSKNTPSPPSSGQIGFHILLGVSGFDVAADTLDLAGDRYTDLVMSNFIAGVMYGHLIRTYTPGMTFNRDYLYGSIFAQLLQENIATQYYDPSSSLIDPSPDQQGVMGVGQGGPYQINNYAADMVYGSYEPTGFSLVNYVALQKNIGFAFSAASSQHEKSTPPIFNDKYYGPMLTAYFHFNDYVALQQIGPVGGYTPQWEPHYDNALGTFKTLPNNFLDVLLNVAYNQGFYGPLLERYSTLGATATASTVQTVDGYSSVWGKDDTYEQYPYQVRYYLDQLYDRPIPTTGPTSTVTPDNHMNFGMAALGETFGRVFAKLAYVNAQKAYVTIDSTEASAAFAASLSQAGLTTSSALDLSQSAQRAQIFAVLEGAVAALETSLGTDFTARSPSAL